MESARKMLLMGVLDVPAMVGEEKPCTVMELRLRNAQMG